MSLSLQNYANTISFVMRVLTRTDDMKTNVYRFIDVCDMIYYIDSTWSTPQKIETIAELIHTGKLVAVHDMIIFRNVRHPNCAIFIGNGKRLSYDELYLMDLLGD